MIRIKLMFHLGVVRDENAQKFLFVMQVSACVVYEILIERTRQCGCLTFILTTYSKLFKCSISSRVFVTLSFI